MGPLRISGTSRLGCSEQLRRCVAQLSPSVGVMKPGGGMNTISRSEVIGLGQGQGQIWTFFSIQRQIINEVQLTG